MSRWRPSERTDWYAAVESAWFPLLVALAALVTTAATALQFLVDPYRVSMDSALFQHAGWWITEGATPYVDFWDLKPPLIYAVTTLLAVLAGGDVATLHLLSVALATAVVAAGIVLVGVLAYRLTDDGVAALVAGASTLVVPSVYAFPVAGIRPKYFAFALGVAALLLAVDDRPAASGAAAAAAAGFWQLGAPIAALVVGIGLQRGGLPRAARTIAGGLLVAAAVVAPFVATGLTVPLFVEVVLAPIYGVERYTLPGRVLTVVVELGYGVLLLPLAAAGWLRAVGRDAARYWWVAAGGVTYLLQIFLELQGAIELVLLLPFLALGVGLLTASVSTPSRRATVAGAVVLLAAASLFWAASPVTPVRTEVEDAQERHEVPDYETLPEEPDGVPSMQTIYWEQRRPETCHYRLGQKQRWYAHQVGTSLDKPTCGQWPYDEPPAEWFASRVGLA